MVEGRLTRAAVRTAVGNGTSSRVRDFKLFEPLSDHRATFDYIVSQSPRLNGAESQLSKVFETALSVHAGQKRKDGERDFIVHALGALYYALMLLQGSHKIGAIALLHDSMEDGPKRGLAVNYSYLSSRFGEQIGRGVAFLTAPKCLQPRENPQPDQTSHVWIFANNSDPFEITRDCYYSHERRKVVYPPEVYREMRRAYLSRLLTKEGIFAFPVKLCDAIDNLSDIEHLSPDSRDRKLEEDRELLRIAARMDWSLFELMAHFLAEWGIEVPSFADEVGAQQRQGVIVCKPRDKLDYEMASEGLPIQHPASVVITVYMDRNQVHSADCLEIGLPRLGNGHKLRRLRELSPDLRIDVGQSLFHGHYNVGARDSIYVVKGLAGATKRTTERRIARFLDGLRTLQGELTKENRQLGLLDGVESLVADFNSRTTTGTDG